MDKIKRAKLPKPKRPPRPSPDRLADYRNATNSGYGPYGYGVAEGVLVELFRKAGRQVELTLRSAAEGRGSGTRGCQMMFPADLADEFGGEAVHYGYVLFEHWTTGMDGGADRVFFGDAFRKLTILAQHYVDWRPERAGQVAALIRRLHATMTQMVADFDDWHRENPQSQWVPG